MGKLIKDINQTMRLPGQFRPYHIHSSISSIFQYFITDQGPPNKGWKDAFLLVLIWMYLIGGGCVLELIEGTIAW